MVMHHLLPADSVTPAWLAGLTVVAILLVGYYLGLPKPIPGIPYDEKTSRNFLGDIPFMIQARNGPGGVTSWMAGRSRRLNSPLVQIFLSPYVRPALFLSDFREAYDLLTRRTKEFDVSGMNANTIGLVIPEHRISMRSSDPRFKGNKELVKDLMTSGFLHEVSAATIYDMATSLVGLWKLKTQIACGRPFEAHQDIGEAATDMIWVAAFGGGAEQSMTKSQIDALSSLKANSLISSGSQSLRISKDSEPFEFPHPPPTKKSQAIQSVVAAIQVGFASPWPRMHLRLLRFFTDMGRQFTLKDKIVFDEIEKSAERLKLADDSGSGATVRSAMDHIILRELRAAEKEEREPVLHSRRIYDELFGYLIAGHETTSSTIAWFTKFLSDNQEAQSQLRGNLKAAFKDAVRANRLPSAAEITGTSVPYLDAFIEESFRYAKTSSIVMREATVDTFVLGHRVPKGTILFIHVRGPYITESSSVHVSESRRSPTSQNAKKRVGQWSPDNINDFVPERWLKGKGSTETPLVVGTMNDCPKLESGSLEFDPLAGPMLAFGAGLRGCSGRRLAYLEMRIILVLLVWHFVFEPCSEELSSYDGQEMITLRPRQCYVKLRPASTYEPERL